MATTACHKTAETLIDGWVHTGDIFKRDTEGHYYFGDRRKDALCRRGENISSFEGERTLNEFPDDRPRERCGRRPLRSRRGRDQGRRGASGEPRDGGGPSPGVSVSHATCRGLSRGRTRARPSRARKRPRPLCGGRCEKTRGRGAIRL